MAKVDYIKQIQTKVNREIRKTNKEWGVSKSQVRENFEQLGIDTDSPTQDEMERIFSEMVNQFTSPETNSDSSDEAALLVADNEPQLVVHTEEDVQPSEEEIAPITTDQQEPANEQGQEEENNSIVPTANNLPSQQPQSGASGLIPQSEVAGLVNQAFNDQPPQLQQQITEYAMQRTFTNVREVQDFLEQMRSMEFDLMVKTLQDHFNRRGNMLSILGDVLKQQSQQDEQNRSDFFGKFQTQMSQFQKEMEAKLSKQGL